MQQICAESKLSPGAVYGYFASKEDLVIAIIDQVLDQVIPEFDAAIGRRRLPPLSEMVGRLLAVVTERDDDGDLARLAVQIWAEALGNPALAGRLSAFYRAMQTRFTDLATAYQQQHRLDAGTPAADIAHVLTMLGPAYLLSRALTGQTTPETFHSGLRALLDQTSVVRRRPATSPTPG
jgi:AcrR family transcriptional regulator